MAMPQFEISKFLTDSDITKKIVLPTQIMAHIPIRKGTNFVDLQVIDSVEQVWKLRYYTRPKGNRASPVFTVGWLRLVRAKRLKAGDKFIFHGRQIRDSYGELRMQYGIQMIRISNVTYQGEPVYLDVENFL